MTASELAIHVLDNDLIDLKKNVPSNITDLVFLKIEENYMKEYKAVYNKEGKYKVNPEIGKTIREHWGLQNCGRCKSPRSRLIGSNEKH